MIYLILKIRTIYNTLYMHYLSNNWHKIMQLNCLMCFKITVKPIMKTTVIDVKFITGKSYNLI